MAKYPALQQELNLKTRQDLLENDYLDKLSEKEKDWLNRFNEEYVNTNFSHEGKRVHPKKIRIKTLKSGEKKKIDVYKNEAEQRNNSRNRCVLTREKARGEFLVSLEQLEEPHKIQKKSNKAKRRTG